MHEYNTEYLSLFCIDSIYSITNIDKSIKYIQEEVVISDQLKYTKSERIFFNCLLLKHTNNPKYNRNTKNCRNMFILSLGYFSLMC